MVKTLILFLLLFFSPVSGFAVVGGDPEPELRTVVNRTQVEMGKYLSVRIEYTGDSVPDISNLHRWHKDFFIDRLREEHEPLANGRIQYSEYLRVYPRKAGDKVLHAIALGGAIALPVSIKVLPAVRDGIDGTPQWQPLPVSIWQGQTIAVSIKQNSLHPSNHIFLEQARFPGFFVQKLDDTVLMQEPVKTIQSTWLLTAQNTGLLPLEAPAIEQRGRGRWRFYLPATEITVKPLPAYMPPTVPVGKLSLRTGIVHNDRQPLWTVVVENQGQLPDEIYGIRSQLAAISGVPVDTIEVSEPSVDEHSPMTVVHRYRVPVPNATWGLTDGPKISVPYFDIEKGRMITVSERLPGVWYFNKRWSTVIGLVLVTVLTVAIWAAIKVARSILAWRHFRQLLAQSSEPHELRRNLLAHGRYTTLESWSMAKNHDLATQIAGQLNCLCYARSCHLTLAEIKPLLIQWYSYSRWLTYQNQKVFNRFIMPRK